MVISPSNSEVVYAFMEKVRSHPTPFRLLECAGWTHVVLWQMHWCRSGVQRALDESANAQPWAAVACVALLDVVSCSATQNFGDHAPLEEVMAAAKKAAGQ